MSLRHVHFGLILTVVCSTATLAADPASVSAPPAYALKNKSVFTAPTDDHRAPFWPIGWVKRKSIQVATAAPARVVEAPKAVALDPKNFKLTSILVGNPSLAIINGRTYSEGEFLRMPRTAVAMAGTPAVPAPRIRVYRVNDGAVVLQNQDQLLTVALQRPELAQRKGEELLLEDRP